ncbi:MAG: hypothetical protein JXM68_09000, partial [Sedimentisphaerales bacterium]|nr:hypothetical protein [Sedimentisphaerales bacterium]
MNKTSKITLLATLALTALLASCGTSPDSGINGTETTTVVTVTNTIVLGTTNGMALYTTNSLPWILQNTELFTITNQSQYSNYIISNWLMPYHVSTITNLYNIGMTLLFTSTNENSFTNSGSTTNFLYLTLGLATGTMITNSTMIGITNILEIIGTNTFPFILGETNTLRNTNSSLISNFIISNAVLPREEILITNLLTNSILIFTYTNSKPFLEIVSTTNFTSISVCACAPVRIYPDTGDYTNQVSVSLYCDTSDAT